MDIFLFIYSGAKIKCFIFFLFVSFLLLFIAEADGRKCHYPGWFLAHNRWQTLDGRWTYTLHKNSTMRIINNTTSGHGTLTSAVVLGGPSFGAAGSASVDSRMEQKAACQSVLDLGDGAARVVAHLSQGWCVSCHVSSVLFHHYYPPSINPLHPLRLCCALYRGRRIGKLWDPPRSQSVVFFPKGSEGVDCRRVQNKPKSRTFCTSR